MRGGHDDGSDAPRGGRPGARDRAAAAVRLHGTGHERPGSDVGLAVLLGKPAPSLRTLAALGADLQEFYPRRKLDLALIERADPLFLKKITENCRLVCGAPRRLHELKMYAFRRYQDHRKYLALEDPTSTCPARADPSVIDRELVTRKMVLIASDLDGMRRIAAQSLGDYLSLRPTNWSSSDTSSAWSAA